MCDPVLIGEPGKEKQYLYDQENEDRTLNYAEGKCFRRKSKKGTWLGNINKCGWMNGKVGQNAVEHIHTMTGILIIDSAEREGGKQYSEANRLAMGEQYKDLEIPGPTIGEWV